MTDQEIQALLTHNAGQINEMDVAAGSVVKSMIVVLESHGRDTYIRLKDPVPGGHIVHYEFVEGDETLIKRAGDHLGFKNVTESLLEVRSGLD